MNGVRVYLLSRSPGRTLALIALVSVVAAIRPAGVVLIDLDRGGTGRALPLVELVPVFGACLLAALQRPRFAEWDRASGSWRPRVGGAVVVLASAALPVLPVLAGGALLPARATWTYIPANVVFVVAAAFIACALLGAARGASLVIVLFAVVCLLQDVVPDAVAFVPIATPPDRIGHPLAAAGALAVAAGVQAWTAGAGRWARRSTGEGED